MMSGSGYLVSGAGIATGVNELLRDPDRARGMGRAGRERVIEHFAWPAIAERTAQLYRSVSQPRQRSGGNAPAA